VESERAPVLTHEEVEVSDHVETANEADAQETQGENGISDVMLGGSGSAAALGLGGGGGGAYGRPGGAGGRLRRALRGGGGKETESAVDAALAWLARHQSPDGSFALPPEGYGIYALAIGTLALAEGSAMSREPKYGQAAQKGIDGLMKYQQGHGGWRHDTWDSTSVLGWVIMALKSAKVAGLKVPKEAFSGGIRRLEEITERDADGYWGKVGYAARGQHLYNRGLTMTAVGMTSFQFLGRGEETRQQVELLAAVPPAWSPGTGVGADLQPQDFYYWYYATLGIFQAGGASWNTWNDRLKKALVPSQRKGGVKDGSLQDLEGSWDPVSGWDNNGGRVYTTALGALCLEVYYRYLPLYHK
jgi:hypothetical protein